MKAKGKSDLKYSCAECGYTTIKWSGRCPECNSWNSFVEERARVENPVLKGFTLTTGSTSPQLLHELSEDTSSARFNTGIGELDRVLGGGLVPGQVVLLGGEPGVGKSTLLLSVATNIARQKRKVFYVTAEESLQQIRLRAKRIAPDSVDVYVLNENNLTEILRAAEKLQPAVIIVDSIQTMVMPELNSSAGSLLQVREIGAILTQIAKKSGMVVFLIGHITKEGAIAGPKILEHMVDTVLYFEGEKNLPYKILRAEKNRFGPSGELGIFQMQEHGFVEVKNISEVFLREDTFSFSGIALTCVIEGMRPIVAEVQSLVSRSGLGIAKRRSEGYDFNRFSLIVAIIEKRLGINLFSHDIFVNITSGLYITDPAADLAVAVAVISSYKNKPNKEPVVCAAELGLCGELRNIPFMERRIRQVEKLGFKRCIIPKRTTEKIPDSLSEKIDIIRAESLKEVVAELWKE